MVSDTIFPGEGTLPMRIVVAPDSFKESLPAVAACQAIAAGLARAVPDAEVVTVPLADGGEGTVPTLVAATAGRIVAVQVTDPLGRPVAAEFGLLGDGATAVIEMAAASGLALLTPAERNPLRTTTFGTGELIREALDRKVRRIVLGIGGSATVDGGVGAAQALGAVFRDAEGAPVGHGGAALAAIESISLDRLDRRLKRVTIDVACDVDNPLIGPTGAARVYGPQKGASPEMVEQLEGNLVHLAMVIQRSLGIDVAMVPGAGAAGGLGAGLMAFLGATLRPGIDIVMDALHFDAMVEGADLVVTGEGRVDGQSVFGKVLSGVARSAGRHGVPVVALAGSLGDGWRDVLQAGVTACFSLTSRPMGLNEALDRAPDLLADAAEQVGRLFCVAHPKPGPLGTGK